MTKKRIEIVRRISAIIAVVLGIAWNGLAETVENVRGSQRENSKLVDIYYDLNDSDGGTYYVEVEVVGKTSDVNASSFSGDVGNGVSPGQNRRVVWDAGADCPDNKGDVKAVVTAIKGGRRNKVQLWEGGPYWADRNIGADTPWDYGLYFWWGDTTGHSPGYNFEDDNPTIYTYGKSVSELQNAGWITNSRVLVPSHDAAHVKWGGDWRMPTKVEWDDIVKKCDWTWTTQSGVHGFIVRGRGAYATNSIFLPAAGTCAGTKLYKAGLRGYYWSSVLYITSVGEECLRAWYLYFESDYPFTHGMAERCDGNTVRPILGVGDVSSPEATTDSSEWFFVDTTDKPTPPTLSAESADWTDGTITLRCEDADLNGADVPFYNLMYYDTAEEKWRVIDRHDLSIPTPVEETNDGGGKSIVTRITDKNFSKRNNGVGTVKYRVVDEADAERMAGCETRKRHGLFVAVGEY